MPTIECHRCRLLESECWRLSQRLAALEREREPGPDPWLLTYVLKRLCLRVGERGLAALLTEPEDAETSGA